jgi:tripartite-type tricarboxylate transporter receptor subunit TctC
MEKSGGGRRLAGALALVLAAAAGSFALEARAQAGWPNRPVKVIVPFPPGVGVDVVVRTVAGQLGERLGQPVVVENRPGAGANIGIEAAARSPGDGYTLLATASNFTANPSLYGKVNYDPVRDFVPVTGLIRTPSVLVVAADSPVKTVDDLVARVKGKPGGLSYASGGNGSLAHFAGELFKGAAGVDAVHVPYKGAPDIINSLLSQQTEYAFPVLVTVLPHLKSGKLRALAVTSPKRSPLLPDVPTMYEAMRSGFEIESENGLVAPAGTPPEIVARLNAEIVRILREPKIADPLTAGGFEVVGSTPAQYGERVRAEVAKYADLVRRSGAKID